MKSRTAKFAFESDRRDFNAVLFSFLLSYCVPLVGIIALLISIGVTICESIQQARLAFYGVKTNATCVQLVPQFRGGPSYIFNFTTETGAVIRIRDIDGVWIARVNDVIPIVYLPTEPEVVSQSGIEGWSRLYFTIAITFFIGVFLWYWSRLLDWIQYPTP